MGLVGIVTESHLVGDGFGDVVQVRTGAVCVDIEVVLVSRSKEELADVREIKVGLSADKESIAVSLKTP